MKRMTVRKPAAFSYAVLAVIFFFVATFFWQTCSVNKAFEEKIGNKDVRETVTDFIVDSKLEDLSGNVFKIYLNSEKKLDVKIPVEYSIEHSNFFFVARDSDGEVFLENYYTDDYSYKKTKTVTVEYFSEDETQYAADTVTVDCYVRSDIEAKDAFYRAEKMLSVNNRIVLVYILSAVFALLCFLSVFMSAKSFYSAGKRRNKKDILSAVPADLLFAALLPLTVLCLEKVSEYTGSRFEAIKRIALYGAGENHLFMLSLYQTLIFIAIVTVMLMLVYSVAFGGKEYIISFVRYKKYPFTHKSVICFVGIQILKSLLIGMYFLTYTNYVLMLLMLEKLVSLPILFKCLKEMQTIMQKTEKYVGGDLSSRIDTKGYFKTFSEHAEDIESVADRISISADEYIQSSKFKAELITNLSHDIKTPLTSILNYAQLLKKENLSQEEKEQFLSVLGRHSVRLQKLIEDLSEVSDATSGKINVKMVENDLHSLVPQIVAGFEEKLQKRDISVKLLMGEDPVIVTADTRLLWRVVDNLLNNICKYAKEGTTAEISLAKTEEKTVLALSNISAYNIEVSGDELTERFTRADSSRHTDGSGLGLSIAKSLMELMDGTLKIVTDKDHFLAQIIF